jgi:hypothetical protein
MSVECETCAVRTSCENSREKATAIWNRRTPVAPSPVTEAAVRLAEASYRKEKCAFDAPISEQIEILNNMIDAVSAYRDAKSQNRFDTIMTSRKTLPPGSAPGAPTPWTNGEADSCGQVQVPLPVLTPEETTNIAKKHTPIADWPEQPAELIASSDPPSPTLSAGYVLPDGWAWTREVRVAEPGEWYLGNDNEPYCGHGLGGGPIIVRVPSPAAPTGSSEDQPPDVAPTAPDDADKIAEAFVVLNGHTLWIGSPEGFAFIGSDRDDDHDQAAKLIRKSIAALIRTAQAQARDRAFSEAEEICTAQAKIFDPPTMGKRGWRDSAERLARAMAKLRANNRG